MNWSLFNMFRSAVYKFKLFSLFHNQLFLWWHKRNLCPCCDQQWLIFAQSCPGFDRQNLVLCQCFDRKRKMYTVYMCLLCNGENACVYEGTCSRADFLLLDMHYSFNCAILSFVLSIVTAWCLDKDSYLSIHLCNYMFICHCCPWYELRFKTCTA